MPFRRLGVACEAPGRVQSIPVTREALQGCGRSASRPVRWGSRGLCPAALAQDGTSAEMPAGAPSPESTVNSQNQAMQEQEQLLQPAPRLSVPILPEKNLGTLRGGMYPFMYDPVYGLPLVQEVAKYGEVLRDMREGQIREILWFSRAQGNVPNLRAFEGRCLIRYKDDRVKQSVLMPTDIRIQQAMEANAIKSSTLPPEPRHIADWELKDNAAATLNPVSQWMRQNLNYFDYDEPQARRGPRVAPTFTEVALLPGMEQERNELYDDQISMLEGIAEGLERMPTEDYEAYTNINGSKVKELKEERGVVSKKKTSWMDNIQITQDQQAMILRLAPIVGPLVGSAFIIGLYMAARLVRGDLTDRMKMMDQEDLKKKRTALKEARIAFLEEEVPALVAKGASLEDVRKKCKAVNSKLGKFDISDTEVESTYEACVELLKQGSDISGAAGSSSASARILAEEEAKEREAAQKEANGGGEANPEDAYMEMGKLNTARVRKAIDPRILDVKRRVRQARRSLKRESKVQLSDEIIFFDDVAGNEQAKVELLEVVDFFRKPEKFRSSGAKVPKGVLLVGPPGNGKTLMARAVAGESGVAFISSSASEFIEMYMGLGAARVRDLFATARGLAPCIIFIDELDAVGRARRGGNEERDNTVNQLLTELDGFEADTAGIVVMGATNRKDVLDAALTRAGRFDRSIEVRRPDFQGRLEGIKVHLRDKPTHDDIDYRQVALLTSGMSGAQVAGVCNTACFLASREGRSDITMSDLSKAVEQAKYGKASDLQRFISPSRKHRFAVMEAAISMVATLLPAIEPVDFVTILPSTKSPIGRTVLKSHIGRYTTGMWTKRYLSEQLLVTLAGRAGEEVVYGRDEMSSLNQSRNMMARQIATKMLNSGMSDHPDFQNLRGLGTNWYDPSSEPNRWQSFTVITDLNQSRSEWIDMDMEMEMKINGAYEEVKELIIRNRTCLDLLIELLMAKERVSGEEVCQVVEGAAHPDDLAKRAQEAGALML